MGIRTKIVVIAAVLAVIAIVIIVGLIPIPQTVAPDWTVTTLDSARRPLMGVTVSEVWQQYSLESHSHEEHRLSDTSGSVRFPRRTYRRTIGARFLGCVGQVASYGVHASCGSHSYLIAFGNGIDTMDWADLEGEVDGTTAPLQRSTLVLKH